MVEYVKPEDNMFFELLWPAIAHGLQVKHEHVGCDEHREKTWKATKPVLTRDSKAENTKTSRWWNTEENSRSFLPKVIVELLGLLHVGWQVRGTQYMKASARAASDRKQSTTHSAFASTPQAH